VTPARVRDLVAALTACAALLPLGQVEGLAPVAFAAMVACASSPWARRWLGGAPWGALHGAAILAAIGWAGLASPVGALGGLLAWFLAHRLLGRAGPDDDRWAVLVCALILAFAAGRTDSPLYVPGWLALALGGPILLVLAQLDGASPRGSRWSPGLGGLVAVVPIGAVVASLTLFLALPRVRAAPGEAGSLAAAGFGGDVELGDVDLVLEDFEPVVHVRPHGELPAGPMYLRGLALDRFDGRRWTTSTERGVRSVSRGPIDVPEGTIALEVRRERIPEGVVFTTGAWEAISHSDVDWLQDDAQGNLLFPTTVPTTLSYTLHTRPPFGAATDAPIPVKGPEDPGKQWLELPDDLDPAVRKLADDVAGGIPSPWGKAVALRDHLLGEYAYSRAPRDSEVEDPLPVFLFERKSGHCEYFASALAVLLRAEGVPSRVVNGFAGGDPNPIDGWIVFRRVHAHAWVEVYDPGVGWVPMDATPGPAFAAAPGAASLAEEAVRRLWYEGVLRYDAAAQADLVLGAGRAVGEVLAGGAPDNEWIGLVAIGVGGGLVAALGWAALGRLARRLAGERATLPRGKVARSYARARRSLAKRGWAVPAALPPVAAARWVRERAGDEAAPLEELAWLHYRVRYGGDDDHAHASRARELAAAVDRIGPPG
jgi:hypothetical protein